MAKRQSGLSQRGGRTEKNTAKSSKLSPTDAELAGMSDRELSAIGYASMSLEESRRHAKTPEFLATIKRLKALRDEEIDYSEIPPISDKRLAAMVRADQYRPVKRTITTRVDADVLEWLKNKAGGTGYQTKLNALLRGIMLREKR